MNILFNSQHVATMSVLCKNTGTRWLAAVALLCFTSSTWAQTSACDLNGDGVVNNTDATLAINMALGAAPCTANVEGPLTCTVITVQRVVNASMGQPCRTYNAHSVTLNWGASPSTNIAGYKVYRGTTSGGPYTLLSSSVVSALTFMDLNVISGQTYYYVATAVDSSGNESSYSAETQGTVPTP